MGRTGASDTRAGGTGLALGVRICGGDIFWFARWVVRVGALSEVWGHDGLGLVLRSADLRVGLLRET